MQNVVSCQNNEIMDDSVKRWLHESYSLLDPLHVFVVMQKAYIIFGGLCLISQWKSKHDDDCETCEYNYCQGVVLKYIYPVCGEYFYVSIKIGYVFVQLPAPSSPT